MLHSCPLCMGYMQRMRKIYFRLPLFCILATKQLNNRQQQQQQGGWRELIHIYFAARVRQLHATGCQKLWQHCIYGAQTKKTRAERDTPILEIVTADISVSRLFLFRTHSQLLHTQNIDKEKVGILLYGHSWVIGQFECCNLVQYSQTYGLWILKLLSKKSQIKWSQTNL